MNENVEPVTVPVTSPLVFPSIELNAVVQSDEAGDPVPAVNDNELEDAINAFIKPNKRYRIHFVITETDQEPAPGTYTLTPQSTSDNK